MQQLISGIAQGAPLWVWPLLAGLLLLGWMSSKDRTTPIAVFYALPLFGLMSLNTANGLPNPSIVWTSFAAGYIVGAIYGFVWQERWIKGFDGSKVALRGEWLTMTVLMITFWSNFAGGTVKAISPDTYTNALFLAVMTVLIAWAGGTFLGRSLRITFAAGGR